MTMKIMEKYISLHDQFILGDSSWKRSTVLLAEKRERKQS
jgi:hypothetical protein